MEINTGDTAWMLTASALVLLMTPGLGFFYAGFVRSKNVLGTIMQSFVVIGLVGVLWVLLGYTLAFAPTEGGLIGNLDFIGMKDVTMQPLLPDAETTIPHEAFVAFQMMFAIITPALITGAFAERAKFSTFLIFMAAWSLLVYAPVAHWVFGAGFLSVFSEESFLGIDMDALDFAGGTAIHVNAGAAALAAAIFYGKRRGFGTEPMEPHNVTYIILGTALLWFGWFGFNAGSAGAANLQAANAFLVTNTAAAAAALTWMFASWAFTGKASAIGAAAGAVAGLVAITPASGFVEPYAAVIIGAAAGLLCYGAVRIRVRSGLDDSLDVVGVHGVGGLWGGIATGLFATATVGGVDGLFYGNADQMVDQVVALAVVAVYSFVVTSIILKALDITVGLRVSDDEEELGLDVTQHGERGYVLDEGGIPVYASASLPTTNPSPEPAPQPEPGA
ncbi:MAG TPA: ammonium transporter [Dehalococcoidia bacterium]|nr:ammonium transporter [Dehalococcoidia bacterium]